MAMMAAATLVFCCTACSPTTSTAADDDKSVSLPFEYEWIQTSSNLETYIVVDKATGVEYLYTQGFRCSTMTPRYNTDGSLVIDPNWSSSNDTSSD